ncbi:hypothetical protein D7X87_19070 [bacterium D16-54]|nr:hypothetical protein D7X87_19070 [bacterium D16-54]RKJ12523.1 hypothetical protein D7X65_19230 [bacterium D16-56]
MFKREFVILGVVSLTMGNSGERYRFFLSDEGYKNARASEKRGEIKIRNHAAVMAGKLYLDKKPPAQER